MSTLDDILKFDEDTATTEDDKVYKRVLLKSSDGYALYPKTIIKRDDLDSSVLAELDNLKNKISRLEDRLFETNESIERLKLRMW